MAGLDVGQVDGNPDAVRLGLGQRGRPPFDLDLQVGHVELQLLAVPAVGAGRLKLRSEITSAVADALEA